MGVNIHVEKPHESIPGVTVGEVGGPIHELVQLLRTLMNETGNVLVNSGYKDLGSFVLEALKEGEKVARQSNDQAAAAEAVLERVSCKSSLSRFCSSLDIVFPQLVCAIPGFRDMAIVDGQRRWFTFYNTCCFSFRLAHVRLSRVLLQKSPVLDQWCDNSLRITVATSRSCCRHLPHPSVYGQRSPKHSSTPGCT